MNEPAYLVGYGPPPRHTRARKARSGNPPGKPEPKGHLKRAFDSAFGNALSSDMQALLEAKPVKVIDALARGMVVDALDGRASAQRLVLSILEDADGGAAEEEGAVRQGAAGEYGAGEGAGGDRDERAFEAEETVADDDRFVFEADEHTRRLLGERCEEFQARIEKAVDAGDLEQLAEIAAEVDYEMKPPDSGDD